MEHIGNIDNGTKQVLMELVMRRFIEEASSAAVLAGFVCVVITWSSAFAG